MSNAAQHHTDTILEAVKKYGVMATLRTRLRDLILTLDRLYYTKLWGMHIHPHTLISRRATLDKTFPAGIHIDEGTAISFDAVVLTHDHITNTRADTKIGKFCQIGARSMIMPGITVGDHSVVAAGSIVTKNVPPHSIVAGVPAKVVRSDIMTARWGRLIPKEETDAKQDD